MVLFRSQRANKTNQYRPFLLFVLARVPAKHDGTVAQTGTVSSVDEEKPIAIKRTRYPLCQIVPSLDTV
jgi:hypothetical protein